MKKPPPVQILKSTASDEAVAVSEIKKQIKIDNIEGLIFFCSSYYNLEKLTIELNQAFDCQKIGCTTAGEIADKYYSNSLVVLVLNSDSFAIHSELINDVQSFTLSEAMKIAADTENNLRFSQQFSSRKMFGFLLTDGLSLKEEKVTSLLYQVMGDINMIGGSAADDLELQQTFVYFDDKFYSNAAVMVTVEVKDDFEVFRMQHFEPTDKELITTDVDFDKRIVKEINGEPAALAYADINGLDSKKLDNMDFSMYPLMLNIADEWYIRSISHVTPENGLQFYCTIDSGLPLSIATGKDLVQRLQSEIEKIEKKYKKIYFTLGCDCIFRRLEIFNKGYVKQVEELLKRINFIGFNSYGEQFNGIHFNQTLVGVVVGEK